MGEGPGQNEDEQGVPFVGKAGQLLDDMLAMIGLDRTQVYIANIVKCRPPQNRDPLNTEREACFPFLRRQMALLQPKLVGVFGPHRRYGAHQARLQDHPGARPVVRAGRDAADGHVPPRRTAAGSHQKARYL